MVEIGIFRKELHRMEMINTGFSLEEISRYNWVDVVDGHEVVFNDSNAELGTLATVSVNGELVELFILREWCNDFRPLSEF